MLLDNLYACGEVSGDGWTWSTQGMADAYVSRNVPYNYSRHGRGFDYEGMNNAYPTGGMPLLASMVSQSANLHSPPPASPPIPNVGGTGNYIWSAAKNANLYFRNYGFFLYFNDNTGIAQGPDNYPAASGLRPPGHDLAGITDYDYRRFDLNYRRFRDAPQIYFQQTHDKNCLFNKFPLMASTTPIPASPNGITNFRKCCKKIPAEMLSRL